MSEDKQMLAALGGVDIFSNLEAREVSELALAGKRIQHKAGQILFRFGDTSDAFHVVLKGTFDCYLWDDLLKIERPLSSFKQGDILGEMGLLTGDKRSAFVRAKDEGETIAFQNKPFFAFLEGHPQVLLKLAKVLAHRLNSANKARGIKFEHLSAFNITRQIAESLPLQVILRHGVLPVAQAGGQLTVAIVDPTDQIARNTVAQFAKQYHVTWVCVSQPDFENFRDKKLFDLLNKREESTSTLGPELSYEGSVPGAAAETSAAARVFDQSLVSAIEAGASDLHFEPGPKGVAIRARIDGALVELRPTLDHATYRPLVSRLKVLADMDITESRLPQDSVLKAKYGGRPIDVRLSTVPANRAEAVACRLFDPHQRRLDLKSLFISSGVADMVESLFYMPSGILLVTGPTGSGKTTTLYAGLQARMTKDPALKLVTAEDPIEYEMEGITQVQVNTLTGLTYEVILRSLLRQDPDVVLVGEMRDKSSMEIALEAALTGHFVLSSLHTNSAFETIMRLRQREIPPYVIASALRGVVSQRLLPRVCESCAEEVEATPEQRAGLAASGIWRDGDASKVFEGKGCSSCRMTGFRGRIGVYEVLSVGRGIRDTIEMGGTLAEIERATPPGSFVSMRDYARLLLQKGLVSPRDLLQILPPAVAAKQL